MPKARAREERVPRAKEERVPKARAREERVPRARVKVVKPRAKAKERE